MHNLLYFSFMLHTSFLETFGWPGCISFAPLLGAPIFTAKMSKSLVATSAVKPLTLGAKISPSGGG